MTATNVLTNVLREIGLEVASPSVVATDFQTQQLLRFMNAAGLDIARRTRWQAMMKTDSIAAATSSHPLPTDFYALDMVYSGAATWTPIRTIIDPTLWGFISSQPSSQPFCHIEGDALLFSPATGADGAVMRYVSDQWVVGKTGITSGSDVLNVPERLVEKGAIYRWKRQAGLPFEDILAELEADIAVEIKSDRGVR